MKTETQKSAEFNIPESVINNTEVSTPEQPKKKSITEIQEERDLSPFKWITSINADTFKYIEFALKHEQDYEKGNWHYIPRSVNPEFKHEHEGKKLCIHIFCTDNNTSKRRLTKIIKRYYQGRVAKWTEFDLSQYYQSK